jgi:hypothetical protein
MLPLFSFSPLLEKVSGTTSSGSLKVLDLSAVLLAEYLIVVQRKVGESEVRIVYDKEVADEN